MDDKPPTPTDEVKVETPTPPSTPPTRFICGYTDYVPEYDNDSDNEDDNNDAQK
jgi:hypothetical protein